MREPGRPPSAALTVRVCQALMAQAACRRQAERDGQVGCMVWTSGPGGGPLQRQADREAGG